MGLIGTHFNRPFVSVERPPKSPFEEELVRAIGRLNAAKREVKLQLQGNPTPVSAGRTVIHQVYPDGTLEIRVNSCWVGEIYLYKLDGSVWKHHTSSREGSSSGQMLLPPGSIELEQLKLFPN